MKYQKITNFLNKANNQQSREWVNVNGFTNNGVYNPNSQIKFNTPMLKSSLCDYSDVYIRVKVTITIARAEAYTAGQNVNKRNKQVTFKNCAPFTNCIIQINNIQVDKGEYLDIVMPT